MANRSNPFRSISALNSWLTGRVSYVYTGKAFALRSRLAYRADAPTLADASRPNPFAAIAALTLTKGNAVANPITSLVDFSRKELLRLLSFWTNETFVWRSELSREEYKASLRLAIRCEELRADPDTALEIRRLSLLTRRELLAEYNAEHGFTPSDELADEEIVTALAEGSTNGRLWEFDDLTDADLTEVDRITFLALYEETSDLPNPTAAFLALRERVLPIWEDYNSATREELLAFALSPAFNGYTEEEARSASDTDLIREFVKASLEAEDFDLTDVTDAEEYAASVGIVSSADLTEEVADLNELDRTLRELSDALAVTRKLADKARELIGTFELEAYCRAYFDASTPFAAYLLDLLDEGNPNRG